MTTRGELLAADDDPDSAGVAFGAFAAVDGVLAPGASMEFSYSVDGATLGITEDGVYPVLVNVNGTTDDGLVRRVVELPSYLVRRPSVPDVFFTVARRPPLLSPFPRPPLVRF